MEMESNCYDYGARFYDPVIWRFHSIDPMADFTSGISPYSYANDNPVCYIDYYGLGKSDYEREEAKRKRRQKRANRQRRRRSRRFHRRTAVKTQRGNKYNPNFTTYGPFTPDPLAYVAKAPPMPADVQLDPFRFPTPELQYTFNVDDDTEPSPSIIEKELDRDWETGYPVKKSSLRIKFHNSSDKIYNTPLNYKLLSDLKISLHEDPSLKVVILGNAYNQDKSVTPDTPAWLNAEPNTPLNSTFGGVMTARAMAIKNWLMDNGISEDRIRAKEGEIRTNISGLELDIDYYR